MRVCTLRVCAPHVCVSCYTELWDKMTMIISVAYAQVLALMGPSGAGKTTLLNMLTLEKSGGVPLGRITINGHPFTFELYQQHACYVTQTDRLWAFLTTREHLELSSALYLPAVPAAERVVAVDELLVEIGLERAQHTRAGNEFFKGLSGGQKRTQMK